MDEKLKAELLAARDVVMCAKEIKKYLKDFGSKNSKVAIQYNKLLDALNEYDKAIK